MFRRACLCSCFPSNSLRNCPYNTMLIFLDAGRFTKTKTTTPSFGKSFFVSLNYHC